jgi:hypothetical protein
MSEKIRPHHLQRKAILYIRQSSPYQVLHNLESQKLQYAMQEHLRRLGWQEIEIIDEDLGRSAAGTATRAGFERMVAQVGLPRILWTRRFDAQESAKATLFGAFGKHNRDEIRKVARDGGGSSIFIDEPARELDAFCRFYDLFAAGKGISRANRSSLGAATSLGRLILSRAAQNGEVRVWHAYIVFGDRARQLHSASLFRVEDNPLRASIGRLNRWLHWQDILEFKRRGVRIYDAHM